MKISKTLESAIEARDLGRIYSSFYTIALGDPGFSSNKFRDTLKYVKSLNIPELMQPFSGGILRNNDWNEEYWGTLASELMDNFCDERIDHLEKVGRSLYKTEKTFNNTEDREAVNVKKKHTTQSYRQKKFNLLPIWIGTGAIVLLFLVIIILVKSI